MKLAYPEEVEREQTVDCSAAKQPLSADELFDVLSNHRRRYTLHYLKRQSEPVSLRDLAEQITAWESGTPTKEISSTKRKRVYTSLQQFHLPKMERLDFIEFDTQRKIITLAPEAQKIDLYLDADSGKSTSWHRYYIGLALLTGMLGLGTWFGIYPLTLFPESVWIVAMSMTFAMLALVHGYSQKDEPGTSVPSVQSEIDS